MLLILILRLIAVPLIIIKSIDRLLLRGEVIAYTICNDAFIAAHVDTKESMGHIPEHLIYSR